VSICLALSFTHTLTPCNPLPPPNIYSATPFKSLTLSLFCVEEANQYSIKNLFEFQKNYGAFFSGELPALLIKAAIWDALKGFNGFGGRWNVPLPAE
jgi:hypothetical protein